MSKSESDSDSEALAALIMIHASLAGRSGSQAAGPRLLPLNACGSRETTDGEGATEFVEI
eukprot:3605372-Rhodomonas_salina.1